MNASQILARRYDNGEPVCVEIRENQIATISPVWPAESPETWPYVAPGFFDIQLNGHSGIWYSGPGLTVDQVLETLRAYWQYGVTRLLPTLITASDETFSQNLATLRKACETNSWAREMVAGIHLEGPYISPEDGPRGAHPREYVRSPNWEEFSRWQSLSGGMVKLMTLAPEHPGSCEFIRRAAQSGVTISIGHTAADTSQIRSAVEAGATLSTHLGNGIQGTLRRHPNPIWDQLGETNLYASLIVDGHHLPPSFVRSVVRAKSTYRTILTCDASGLAGSPPGIYELGSGRFEILADGRIVIAGQQQLLAGSSLGTDTCVLRVQEYAGIGLREAVDMATRTPARLLNLPQYKLDRGSPANLVIFENRAQGTRLKVLATYHQGVLVYGNPPKLCVRP